MTKNKFETLFKNVIDKAKTYDNNDDAQVTFPDISVEEIRKKLGLTQAEFAQDFLLSVGSVRNWEQNIRTPDKATLAYLIVIKYMPEAVLSAISMYIDEATVSVIGDTSVENPTSPKVLQSDTSTKGVVASNIISLKSYSVEIIQNDQPTQLAAAGHREKSSMLDLNVLARVQFDGFIWGVLFKQRWENPHSRLASTAIWHDFHSKQPI